MQNAKSKAQRAICISISLLLILAVTGCGAGSSSPSAPPSAPGGMQLTVSAANELTLSWNPDANAISYNIYFAYSPGVSKASTKLSCNTSGNCVCTTKNNCVLTGLSSGIAYYYAVTAVNSNGEGNLSAEVHALLAKPISPGAVAAVAGDGQAALNWNTTGATSYHIYMASQPGVTTANYSTLPDGQVFSSTTGAFTKTGLQNGMTYYFVVTSVNGYYGESSESSEVAATPAMSNNLTVSGSVKYEDKEYGTSGFTGKTFYKAVRFAGVEAVDTSTGLAIASATTDAAGMYSLTLPATASIYIRAISSASSPISAATPLVAVKDLSNALYSAAGVNFTVTGASIANISIPATSPAAGAFNILDVLFSGAQFVQSLSGGYPPALTAFWQTGNSNGTYYCSSTPDPYCPHGEGIYILNYLSDTDEYDDDVLWHEYGHFIAARYSKDDSPGGVHYLSSNDLDLRLTFSEGWGDFMPLAVKAWLGASAPALLSTTPAMSTTLYVDTAGGSASYFDFGSPAGSYVYASNEAAVARIMIGLRSNFSMQDIWDVMTSNYLKTATMPVNLEIFWDAWSSLGKADITPIFAERLIAYSADAYEAAGDNTPNPSRKAVLGSTETHTLYGSADTDYVAFDVLAGQKYTITTTALKNGADTVIRIIEPVLLAAVSSNDNTSGANYAVSPFVPSIYDPNTGEYHENRADILGSTAGFTATASGTYYVEVKSSPGRPLSAGKYGGYSLTLTSP